MCLRIVTVLLALLAATVRAVPVILVSAATASGSAGLGSVRLAPARITDNLQQVLFTSIAANLATVADTNSVEDAFVRALLSNTTSAMSTNIGGTIGNSVSLATDATPDGRFVVMCSLASNLVANDTGFHWDVFLRDTQTGVVEPISVTPAGYVANGDSGSWEDARISADGRFVVFSSTATDLTASGDSNGSGLSVFLRDRQLGVTTLISVNNTGVQPLSGWSRSPFISDDGSLVAFVSSAALVADDTNAFLDVYVRHLVRMTTWRVSVSSAGEEADSDSGAPVLSRDGSVVVFPSGASNLDPALDNNGFEDVFAHRLADNTTTCVSVSALTGLSGNGVSGAPSVSYGGELVAFHSAADNLVSNDTNAVTDIFVRNFLANTTSRINVFDDASQSTDVCRYPSISRYGECVTFIARTNDSTFGHTAANMRWQVFMRCDSATALPSAIPSLSLSASPTSSSTPSTSQQPTAFPSPSATRSHSASLSVSLSASALASLSPTASASVSPSTVISMPSTASASASPTRSERASMSPSPAATLACDALSSDGITCLVSEPLVFITPTVANGPVALNTSITFGSRGGLRVVNGSLSVLPGTTIVVRVTQLPVAGGEELVLLSADGGVVVDGNVSVELDSSGVPLGGCERVVATQRRTSTRFAVLLTLGRDDSLEGCRSSNDDTRTRRLLAVILPCVAAAVVCASLCALVALLLAWRSDKCYHVFRYELPEDRALRRASKHRSEL